jgi:hypothetical protein
MPNDIRAEYAKCYTLNDPIKVLATRLVHHIFLRNSEIFSFKEEKRVFRDDVKSTPETIADPKSFKVVKTLYSGFWTEIDFEKKLWEIPAIRMKKKRAHVVPLSIQVMEILKEIYAITGNTGIIFPRASSLTKEEKMTVPADYMGDWFDEAKIAYNPHYCRTIANSWIRKYDEDKYDKAISIELSHVQGNKTKRAYDYKAYLNALPLRFEMMQLWSDFLEPRQVEPAQEPSKEELLKEIAKLQAKLATLS